MMSPADLRTAMERHVTIWGVKSDVADGLPELLLDPEPWTAVPEVTVPTCLRHFGMVSGEGAPLFVYLRMARLSQADPDAPWLFARVEGLRADDVAGWDDAVARAGLSVADGRLWLLSFLGRFARWWGADHVAESAGAWAGFADVLLQALRGELPEKQWADGAQSLALLLLRGLDAPPDFGDTLRTLGSRGHR